LELSVDGLAPATFYTVDVVAILRSMLAFYIVNIKNLLTGNTSLASLPVTTNIMTAPLPPTVSADLNQVAILSTTLLLCSITITGKES
jgi:hypothetical protein